MQAWAIPIAYLASCTAAQLYAQEKEHTPRATLVKADGTNGALVLKVSPDGKTVATGHGRLTGVIDLWDVNTGKKIGSCGKRGDGRVHLLAYSPDGKLLASCGQWSPDIILSDVTTYKDISTLKGLSPYDHYRSIAFSPDGKRLAAGVDAPAKKEMEKKVASAVLLWEIDTGRTIATYKDFAAPVTSLAFSADGKTIITMEGPDFGYGTVKLWDTPSSQAPDR
jgi:WD40 repeat protein